MKRTLLALDIATNTGFCTATASGTWNLAPKRDESAGMRCIRFKGKLKEICEIEGIKLVVFEMAAGFHKNALIVEAELIGVLKLFCEENGIQYKSYPPASIKKDATGKGNAKKDQMIEAAQKYKPGVTSNDEADAIHIYHYAIKDLNL